MYEEHGQADNGGKVARDQLDKRIVAVLDAIGAGFSPPEARVKIAFEPGAGWLGRSQCDAQRDA